MSILVRKEVNLRQILNNLLQSEDNRYCADCSSKCPTWASWNLGIFLCINCASIHRSLGTTVSRVKSLSLDEWTSEQVAVVAKIGNRRANAYYEADLPETLKVSKDRNNQERFIFSKYAIKLYVNKDIPHPLSVQTSPERGVERLRSEVTKRPIVAASSKKPPLESAKIASESRMSDHSKEVASNVDKSMIIIKDTNAPVKPRSASSVEAVGEVIEARKVASETLLDFGDREVLDDFDPLLVNEEGSSLQSRVDEPTSSVREKNIMDDLSFWEQNKAERLPIESILSLYNTPYSLQPLWPDPERVVPQLPTMETIFANSRVQVTRNQPVWPPDFSAMTEIPTNHLTTRNFNQDRRNT